ncbi:MAG: hypothetical protein HYS40_01680 [Gemmatimonadetes bacterium]|nr:hypothetical protein [Gemmatimonadota bacterium]
MKPIVLSAVVAALLHITPVVVLVKRTDAVTRLLPGADAFAAREVHLSEADAHRLHETVDWSPEDGVLTFYIGRRGGAVVGTLEFQRVDTPHGPIEVAVGFGQDGAIRGVEVTKATAETRHWVQETLAAGLTSHYQGLKAGDPPGAAAHIRARVGALPFYMAEQVDKAVVRALAVYRLFYR